MSTPAKSCASLVRSRTLPLGVYVQVKPELPDARRDEFICSFDDDGYFWFLAPLIEELRAESSETIDLYGLAVFRGASLDALERFLDKARRLADTQQDHWEFTARSIVGGTTTEGRSTVYKREMLSLLGKLQAGVARAREADFCIAFWGD